MAKGQCRYDPVTGIAGDIYTAWTGDAQSGLYSGVIVSGSVARNLFGAQIEAFAASINAVAPTLTPLARSASFSADPNNYYRINCTTGNVTVTLPASSTTPGQLMVFKRVDGSANTITLNRAGGDLIDGATTYSLAAQYDGVTLIASSVGWDVLSRT